MQLQYCIQMISYIMQGEVHAAEDQREKQDFNKNEMYQKNKNYET